MKHLSILLFMIIFMSGVMAISYFKRMHKIYKAHFLRRLFFYLILLNLSVLNYLCYEYVLINLYGDNPSGLSTFFPVGMMIMVIILEVGMVFVFIRLTEALKRQTVMKNIHTYFMVSVVLISCSYFVGIANFIRDNSLKWIETTSYIILYSAYILTIVILINLIIRSRHQPVDLYSSVVLAFGTVFIVIYILRFIVIMLPIPIMLFALPAVLLLFNLSPCIWFQRFYLKHLTLQSLSNHYSALDILCQQYVITRREREIVELIILGKSNHEISETLFISINTVRNHIYRLYKKLDINSRGQLIHLILKAE